MSSYKVLKKGLTFDIKSDRIDTGGDKVTDVRKVYITREVAEQLNLTPTYLIKLAKKIELNETEMREAGRRNYLFSDEAVEKLMHAKQKK